MAGNILFAIFIVLVAVVFGIYAYKKEQQRKAVIAATPLATRLELAATDQHGAKNPSMLCPHCQTRGEVRTRPVVMKKGVSGGKAAAAVMTAGLSTLAVGLSRKENLTSAWCGNCKNHWTF